MKLRSYIISWGLPILTVALLVVLVAWSGNPQDSVKAGAGTLDTIPGKQRPKTTRPPGDKDLDKELRELERAKAELEEVNWDKIRKEIESAIDKIDLDKAKLETEKALKDVDAEKLQKEIKESIKKIDFDKIDREIQKALREIEKIDISAEMEAAGKEVKRAKREVEEQLNNKEWRKEMEEEINKSGKDLQRELKRAAEEVERAVADMDLEKLNMTKELDNARVEIDKAKEELKGYQEMIYAMEKDGLFSTKNDYKIEYNNGELWIDGKKQSKATADKYRKYFKRDKEKTTIIKQDGDFNIDID